MGLAEYNADLRETMHSHMELHSKAPSFVPYIQANNAQVSKNPLNYKMYSYYAPPPVFHPHGSPSLNQSFPLYYASVYPAHNSTTYNGTPDPFQFPPYPLPYLPQQKDVRAESHMNKHNYQRNYKDAYSSWQQLPISPDSPAGILWFHDNSGLSQADILHHARPPITASITTPRGPPQKPRQSGHALWVGNLPPNTDIMDLKNHFVQGAKSDIESLKLISKSGCAFVNYRTQDACSEAMVRFHGAEFLQTKLVCRLRKRDSTAETKLMLALKAQEDSAKENNSIEAQHPISLEESQLHRIRYFVLKSMTLEDLDLSVQNGMWATQAHNETALNEAFKSADDVYLFFSANRSGEYYGCAKMTGPICCHENYAVKEQASSAQGQRFCSQEDDSLPAIGIHITPTPATQDSPAGRIVFDQARDTLFWEVVDEGTSAEQLPNETGSKGPQIVNGSNTPEDPGMARCASEDSEGSNFEPSLNRSFSVHWISRQSVPFYKTRSLRNSWNANRAVKIARDGTELDPDVGKKLFGLFFPYGEPLRV